MLKTVPTGVVKQITRNTTVEDFEIDRAAAL
jgi:hypothetical protein